MRCYPAAAKSRAVVERPAASERRVEVVASVRLAAVAAVGPDSEVEIQAAFEMERLHPVEWKAAFPNFDELPVAQAASIATVRLAPCRAEAVD